MADYTKITDYAAKDALSTGNPSKIVKGAEIGAEFDALVTAIASKADKASPTFTGTVVIPTPFTIGAVSMTATGTELNFVDGVTSAIQTQLDAKQPLDADLTALAGLTSAANKIPMFSGSGTATVIDFKDEDNMVSDSATAVPSQQSVKSYGDNLIANAATATPNSAADYFIFEDATDSTQKKALLSTIASGGVVQVTEAEIATVVTCTSNIPADDTVPQNTEGTQFLTCSITPTDAANKLLIEVTGWWGYTGATSSSLAAVALFQDTTANALAAAILDYDTDALGKNGTFHIRHYMTAGTTSSTTFKARGGAPSNNLYINATASANHVFGAAGKTVMTVTEIKV